MSVQNSFNTWSLTHRLRKLTYGCQWAGIVRDFGKVMYTLLYLKWLTNKGLMYSPWNSTQCYVPIWLGGEFGGEFSSVQSLSRVRLFATPWITAHQASLSITNSWSSLKLMSIKSVMPSSHLILCRPLLLLPLIPPSIRVFSNESTLLMGWPKYWSQHQSFQWTSRTDL